MESVCLVREREREREREKEREGGGGGGEGEGGERGGKRERIEGKGRYINFTTLDCLRLSPTGL